MIGRQKLARGLVLIWTLPSGVLPIETVFREATEQRDVAETQETQDCGQFALVGPLQRVVVEALHVPLFGRLAKHRLNR